jgi:hypothetical protein
MTRTAAVAILLCALAGCSRQSGPQVRLLYEHSGAPGDGLEMVALNPVDGKEIKRATTDSAGLVNADFGPNWLLVRDPRRNVVLVERASIAPNQHELRVPEPIRVRGTFVTTGDVARVKVRVGFGDRVPAVERRRANVHDPFVRPGDENRPFGITLPLSPLVWTDATTAGAPSGASFESGWIAARAPQVVAFDPEGRIAVADVVVPAHVTPGTTVEAGALSLSGPAALNIRMEIPASDLPLGFMLDIATAAADPATAAGTARVISVLDQVNPPLFDLLTRRARYPLSSGLNSLAPFPALRGLKIAVLDSSAGVRMERSAAMPAAGVATLDFDSAELSPHYRQAATKVVGRVVLAGSSKPVGRAKVVFSDFPERRETVTNDDGAFEFTDVHNDRPVTIFVDSRASAIPAGYDATHVFRGVDARGPLNLEIPQPPYLAGLNPTVQDDDNCTADDQYPSLAGYITDQGVEHWAPIGIYNVNPQTLQATVSVPVTGYWNFRLALYPFWVALGGAQFNQANQQQTVQLGRPQGLQTVTLQFFNPNNSLSIGTAVYFASFTEDPDPVEFDTDNNGVIRLHCVNMSPIYVYVDIGPGYYDGNVNLTGAYKAVTLCTHQAQNCTE